MLVVETIARIRREHLGKGVPIKQIARELRLSRNTVREVVRSDETSFRYERTDQAFTAGEAMQGRSRLSGVLLAKIYATEAPLLPTCRSRWEVEPPDEAVGERCQRHTLAKRVAQQLLLVIGECRAGALHLDQDERSPRPPKTVVDLAVSNRVLASDLTGTEGVPAQGADDGIDHHFSGSLFTGLREIGRGQPRDQCFQVGQIRHCEQSLHDRVVCGRKRNTTKRFAGPYGALKPDFGPQTAVRTTVGALLQT